MYNQPLPFPWPLSPWGHTAIPVGPCAWRAPLLAAPTASYIHNHPSLIVIDPDATDQLLQQIGSQLRDLPFLLSIREPQFTRRLPELIRHKLRLLGKPKAHVLTLHSDDEPAALKSGSSIHVITELRHQGVIDHLGLASPDPRHAEWLALHTTARVLLIHYSLTNQAPWCRAIPAAHDYGMACLAHCPTSDHQSLRFALGRSHHVLPILDAPIPNNLLPMTDKELETAWNHYQSNHPMPDPLPRGRPPIE